MLIAETYALRINFEYYYQMAANSSLQFTCFFPPTKLC